MPLIDDLFANSIPEPNSGCWFWLGNLDSGGYGQARVKPERVPRGVHRLSYQEFIGEIPVGMVICHKCDVRSCINPDHLFCGTQAENLADASRKGRLNWTRPRLRPHLPRGERHHAARLNEDAVRAIRASNEQGIRLAARYYVNETTISKIRKGLTWGHIL